MADEGSITSAATKLGVSQPALSAQIGRLESRLESSLFVRRHQGVEPTALGRLILDHARSILDDLERMDRAIARARIADGPLRLAANYSTQFSNILAFLVDAGHQREVVPRVDISTTRLTRELANGSLDMGIVGVHPGFDDQPPDGIEQLDVVETEPFLLALSARHALADQKEVDVADLASDAWLLPPGEPDGTDLALRAVFGAAGIDPATPYGRQDINEFWPYVAAGKIVAVTLPTIMPPSGSGVVVRAMRGMPLFGRQVIRWHPDRATRDEARLMARAALVAFHRQLELTAHHQDWWHDTPGHRPVDSSDVDQE